MVQIVGSQQSNGQCPGPQQTNTGNSNSASNSYRTEHATSYTPDTSGNGRHRYVQVCILLLKRVVQQVITGWSYKEAILFCSRCKFHSHFILSVRL